MAFLDGLFEALEVLAAHAEASLEDAIADSVGTVGEEERHWCCCERSWVR